MFIVFQDLCNQKFPVDFILTDDFQEFSFIENYYESTLSNCQEEVSVSLSLERISVSSSNNESNIQKMKDLLSQTLTVYEEIETRHQEEINCLKQRLKSIEEENFTLKSQCETLQQEKNDLHIELQNMKDSMKQFVSNFVN